MENEFQQIKLIRAKLPALPVGRYKVCARQSLSSPVRKELPALESTFVVKCRNFTLMAGDIYSHYPSADTEGAFGHTLPHLVLNRTTLPWMRRRSAGQKETQPWLALICLGEGEGFTIRTQTIAELVNAGQEKGVYHPAYTYDSDTGELGSDLCQVVDVETSLLEAVMPRERELEYLCHVRAVDLYHTADEIIPRDGLFATVVSNRFPVTSQKTAKKNTALLISLEGYQGRLPEGEQFSEVLRAAYARFVVLYRWSFTSQEQLEPGFRKLMSEIKAGPLALPHPEAEQDIAKLFARGYVPLRHNTRTGERTVSFYRGPLTPFRIEPDQRRECATADGEIRYDPALGMFDMTYAAAWQLGRLLMMADENLARLLYQWRKGVVTKVFRRRQCGAVQTKMMRQRMRPADHNGSLRETALELFCSKVRSETISPLADPTGLRQDATQWLTDHDTVRRAHTEHENRREPDGSNP